ncbi:MAG TPA: quinone-dependent dihydroorotate dehydrogenase [Candidatus Paenalcaligenes intestinipullorum]|uniref:Dihydroorotate dehydrogenase (quinone) n=1 Tax=Candidatus Paenalcaligenes intestinipullorum TaxID=2838718 RepID=A0A9D2U943_9BURK|nr:quinone-dependent dihydroorotate dehydrogenase [Candidatus Paenalcaligenes intestinipullorum]
MSILFKSYAAVRPLLFNMDAERAHNFTLSALNRTYQSTLLRKALPQPPSGRAIKLMGLRCRNAVGLAAGLDKNGEYIDALAALGFGFVEVGTVTPLPQAGNPQPRLFRLPQQHALINRFGFNNHGLSQFVQHVKQSQWRSQGGILGLNIGKNAATPMELAVNDYLTGLDAVYPHADYVTVNISSPNTENLRALQSENELNQLLGALNERRKVLSDQYQRYVPIAVKIAPDLDKTQITAIAQSLLTNQIDGVIATNTTLSRDLVAGLPHADEKGGLSGPPVHALSLMVIRALRRELGPEFPIIGVGGIQSGYDAQDKLDAGANAVQLYTGLIYKGPQLIHDCIQQLALNAR